MGVFYGKGWQIQLWHNMFEYVICYMYMYIYTTIHDQKSWKRTCTLLRQVSVLFPLIFGYMYMHSNYVNIPETFKQVHTCVKVYLKETLHQYDKVLSYGKLKNILIGQVSSMVSSPLSPSSSPLSQALSSLSSSMPSPTFDPPSWRRCVGSAGS